MTRSNDADQKVPLFGNVIERLSMRHYISHIGSHFYRHIELWMAVTIGIVVIIAFVKLVVTTSRPL